MAQRFAVSSGNWSNTAIWDNGVLPTSTDDIFANGFGITIDQDITVASLRNTPSNVTIPNITTPSMTSNTQPTGTVISSNNSGTAYYAFNQDGSTGSYWQSSSTNTGWLGYQFSTGKTIKRYIIKQSSLGQNTNPKTWNFEGSNNGTTWDILDPVASYTTNATYTSSLLANTTSYTYYRINITASFNAGSAPAIAELEMTENTTVSPVYGSNSGGSFAVPSTLSGSRNIVQTGTGIITNNTTSIISLAHTTGNTVNFNVSGSGVIFNTLWFSAQQAGLRGISCDGTGTTNFNGDIQGNTITTTSYTQGGQIYISGAGTVNIYGNIIAAYGSSSAYNNQIAIAAAATLNITGILIGSTGYSNSYNINVLSSNATINITGNITSNIGVCINSSSNTIVNVPTGTVTVTNTNSAPAIVMTSLASLLTLNSPIINKANANAVVSYKMRFYSTATPYWVFQNTAAADITLAYGSATGSYPNEADVRYGTNYAASPTRTGTLRVPLPQYVSQGVLVDATVGTAYLSATDVWNVLTSTMTTSGSIGERLKNASTVQTTGDQLASYQV